MRGADVLDAYRAHRWRSVVFLSLVLSATAPAVLHPQVPPARAASTGHAGSQNPPLRKVSEIPLGRTREETPADFGNVTVGRRGVIVIDHGTREVRRYSRDGALMHRVSFARSRQSQLVQPIVAFLDGDTTYAVDLDPNRGITVVGPTGAISRKIRLEIGSAAVMSAMKTREGFAFGVAVDPNKLAGGELPTTARFTDLSGRLTAEGCPVSGSYAKSAEKRGMLAMYQAFTLKGTDNVFFCHDPASATVRIINASGDSLGVIGAQPPWYIPPRDVPMSMNPVDDEKFQSQYTAHSAFHPTRAGFVSVYQQFRTDLRRPEYRAFKCPSRTQDVSCSSLLLPGKVLDFLSPDTLVVLEGARTSDGRRKLGLYVLKP